MNDQLSMFGGPTAGPPPTSSPGSEAGLSPSAGPAGLPGFPSGPAPVLASRFHKPAGAAELLTSVTCGLFSDNSSPSAALQLSLESRLLPRMDAFGSPEYALTWRRWDMLSGPPLCALQALEAPTSGSGFTGWPTPRTPTGGPESADRKQELGRTESGGGDLQAVALLAGWPTPLKSDSDRSQMDRLKKDRQTRSPKMRGSYRHELPDVAKLTGWATPRAEDSESSGMRHSRGAADTLSAQAGQDLTSSPAGTGPTGVLNPAHPRWLQGFPPIWDEAIRTAALSGRRAPGGRRSRVTATPSSPSSPPSSYAP
jgi:hypothetical protein